MSEQQLEAEVFRFGEKHNIEELQALVTKTSSNVLINALVKKLGKSDCTTFWNYLLQGFTTDSSNEKRFNCIKAFLNSITKIELSCKQTYDLITRLCLELRSFSSDHLVEILEYCMDGIRAGDPKCVGWKDLLPETVGVLCGMTSVSVNGTSMSGTEYRDIIVRNICIMKWPIEILTPIANMFRELQLTSAEIITVLNKFCTYLHELSPSELPSLAYQLFSICATASQIIIPILGMEKYFYRYYYKKLFADMNSNTTDFDSIDAFSDKELREAEETIHHHLNYCTQYKINEIQMCIVLRNFLFMPDIILTPFVLSSILSMTAANRDPDSRISASVILAFLRGVIKHNEDEKKISDYSVWCRDIFQSRQANLEQIFTVLIDQNKDGKDVVTPGLVNLAFTLLRTKNSPILNSLGIGFLTKFIRKRFVFGQGVLKKLAEWMIVDQEAYQYSECLTILSVSDTFTVSECIKTINYVMDFFLWIPGEQAMRMMSFILPILKISTTIRDSFIEILRKAMNSSDTKTRRMGVYGFCMILKQLNNSNSQRSTLGASGFCTQQSISGYSLMSQMTLGKRNNPQCHFDMLTLEIIGLLRNCFNQTIEIKRALYENLQRAVELNPKLVPHILQFIDWHFRSYFDLDDSDDTKLEVNFAKIVQSLDENDNKIEIKDNIGRLALFVSYCLSIFEKFEHDYDTREMKRLLDMSERKIAGKQLKFEDMCGPLTYRKNEIVIQQLNFIEGIMGYAIITSSHRNENVKHILAMFKEHYNLSEALKNLSASKKGNKKGKNLSETDVTTPNVTINGVVIKKFNSKLENIWDMPVTEKFLRLLFEDIVPFASADAAAPLRSNRELVRYVIEVASAKVLAIRSEPEYKQLAHSRRTLKNLTNITRVVYERCIKQLPMIWKNFDMKTAVLCAECLHQCLVTANELYKKKFDVFLKDFDFHCVNKCKEAPSIIQEVIDEYMVDNIDGHDVDEFKIPYALFQCLEILYDNICYSNRLTIESYSWLLKFCKEHEVNTKEMGIVHKLLFTQRQKTHSGMFFNTIAMHLEHVLGRVKDVEDENNQTRNPNLKLKSITLGSAESCINYLYATLKKQIEDVEYFIAKSNNMNFKLRVVSEEDRDMVLSSLRLMERSICSQLIHISNTLLHLSNACVPLGVCMDFLLRILMQIYICLKNLTKHFLNRCAVMKVSIQGTKFDMLLHVVGKPLPNNIYFLITYIEANILEDQLKKKTPNPQAEKAKILRETKLIPKLILCVENFNKHVILLSKKTNDRLANYLHLGTVRDFRIKTSELKAAIDRTLSHSSQIEEGDSDAEQHVCEEDEDTVLDRMESESAAGAASVAYEKVGDDRDASTPSEINSQSKDVPITNSEDGLLKHESNNETNSQLLKNLAKINLKAKKRTLRASEQNAGEHSVPVVPEPKKRRGRSKKST